MPRPERALAPVGEAGEVVALLRELLAEVRLLREALGQRPAPPVALLRAIRERVGDRVFTAVELAEHAEVVGDLRAEILAAVGSLSPRKIGRALAAIEGEEAGGFRVVRVGQDRLGIIWSLRVCEN